MILASLRSVHNSTIDFNLGVSSIVLIIKNNHLYYFKEKFFLISFSSVYYFFNPLNSPLISDSVHNGKEILWWTVKISVYYQLKYNFINNDIFYSEIDSKTDECRLVI